jgi:hypothetical protein
MLVLLGCGPVGWGNGGAAAVFGDGQKDGAQRHRIERDVARRGKYLCKFLRALHAPRSRYAQSEERNRRSGVAARRREDSPAGAAAIERDGHFAEAIGEHLTSLQRRAGGPAPDSRRGWKSFNLGQIVRGEKDGGFRGALDEAFDQLVAHQRIEAAETARRER